MGDPSFGCRAAWHKLLPTPISPSGNGWALGCDFGHTYWDGNILPTFGVGGTSQTTVGKLLPSGDTDLPGTFLESSRLTGYFGLNKKEAKEILSGQKRVGWTTSETNTSLGFGKFSATDTIGWHTFSIRKDFDWGAAFSSGRFSFQPTVGIGLESILNIDKPDSQATLRDNARILSIHFNIELSFRDSLLVDTSDDPAYHLYSAIHYIYTDLLAGADSVMNYLAVDKDIDITKSHTGDINGIPVKSTEPSSTSSVSTLLSSALFLSARGVGKSRQQFKKIREDWQNGLIGYHVARTALFGGIAAASERPVVLAPAAFSSGRNLLDILAVRFSKTPREALTWHLGIGVGMFALGAAAHKTTYGRPFAQAGMEGLTATTLSPDAFDKKGFIEATTYDYQALSLYNRSTENLNIRENRPSLRLETTLKDSALYFASEISTPMAGVQTTQIQMPSAVVSGAGLRASSYEKGHPVSVHGKVGGNLHWEWNNVGAEPGFGAEIGGGIDFHPSDSWSLGLSGRCSAAKFVDGHATQCGVGLNLQLHQENKE